MAIDLNRLPPEFRALYEAQTQGEEAKTKLIEQQLKAGEKQLGEYGLYGQPFEQNLQLQQFGFQKDQAAIQNQLQRQSLDLQAQVRRGELSLSAAQTKLDRAYKEASLRQNERVARANALAQAQALELQAAGYRLPKGQKYFPGFEPTGLASQLAKQYGYNFTAPETVPIPFNPTETISAPFAGVGDISLPDTLSGLDFGDIGSFGGGTALPSDPQTEAYQRQIAGFQRQAIGDQGGGVGIIGEDVQQLRGGNIPIPGAGPGYLPGVSAEELQYTEQQAEAERERQRQIMLGYGVDLR